MNYRITLLGDQPDWLVKYVSSLEDDVWIVCDVLKILKAHTAHLAEIGVIPRKIAIKILSELSTIEKNPKPILQGKFEDVHEAIEKYLHRRIGNASGWLALGRSRNDHVATALRMRAKIMLLGVLGALLELRKKFLNKATDCIDVIIPAHTHFQPAQPSTLGHYLMAIEEDLADSWKLIYGTLNSIDKCPLGAGAAVGTSVPLDRVRLSELLGFKKLITNTLYATSSRTFLFQAASAVYSVMLILSRFAEDIILWSHPSLKYVELPKQHFSTSSLMPHKKNPVTMEILRARTMESLGDLVAIAGIEAKQSTGYNLDLQEISKHVWRIMREAIMAMKVVSDIVPKLEPTDRGARDVIIYPVAAPDIAEALSLSKGISFREAHKLVASYIAKGYSTEAIAKELLNDKYCVNPLKSIECKRVAGSPSPQRLKESIELACERVKEDKNMLLRQAKYYIRKNAELTKLIETLLKNK